MSKLVICPRLDEKTFRRGKVVHVAPIVRQSFLSPIQNREPELISLLLSGSAAANQLSRELATANLEVSNLNDLPDVRYGLQATAEPAIDHCVGVITQCGYQTLSEILARDVPALLLPVNGSPEQLMNARYLASTSSHFRVIERDKLENEFSAWKAAICNESARQRRVRAVNGSRDAVACILAVEKE